MPAKPKDSPAPREPGRPGLDDAPLLEADQDSVPPPSDPSLVQEAPHRPAFPIVGIGASAGGLEALQSLTHRLSSDGMAFIVMQHLAPGHESMLRDILARGTSMEVVTVHDGVKVEINRIFVTPPNAEISLEQGVLRLRQASERIPRNSIDALFRTLAADAGPMAIGVILSGAGTDGTAGLRAIQEAGGITFVQEPSTASQPSMPQSAIDAGCADFCLGPDEIGDELMRLGTHPYVARKHPKLLFKPDTLQRLFALLRGAFRVDFSVYKTGTIERRIQRRMALQRIESFEDYVKFVESSGGELRILYSDLLIGVTSFFRDREPFESLKSSIFPRLLENRNPSDPIRIWVPGCSSGEEAYSVAICLLEVLGRRANEFKVQIFGTDIDDRALARARHGHYPQSIEPDVSPERLQRFFSRYDRGYQVSRQVRDLVVFARHNLGKDPPFSRLDLISCRNVLIYMQAQLQRKVLRVFHYALNPDGFLLLGTSESVGDASDLFTLVDRKLKIYLKKNVASAAVFDFGLGGVVPEIAGPRVAGAPQLPEHRAHVSVQQLADRKVIEKFGPPGVLLDENLDVIQFRGQTGPYLAPSPGSATLNVLKLVRAEFLVQLRLLLQQVASDGVPRTSDPVALHGEKEGAAVLLEVVPLQRAGSGGRSMLVLFREITGADQLEAVRASEEEMRKEPRVQQLERDLLVTKEYLESTVQDLETANEELQSANEELQSSNEELQSTNEELETSKEELQSTNEELATVNEELENRMAELNMASDDLKNVLGGISLAFIIVGMELRIRRFSARAGKLLNLIPADIGRPIGHLASALRMPDLEKRISETINMVKEQEERVRLPDGHWYMAHMSPYRTSEHSIRGAVVEFLRLPAWRKAGEPAETYEFIGKVLATLPHSLVLLDDRLRILWATSAFQETFKLGDVIGRTLDDVWDGRETHGQLFDALEEAVRGQGFSDILVSDPFRRMMARPMKFSARSIPAEGDRPALTLLVIEEAS